MRKPITRKKDLPVTQGMFGAFKDELFAVMNSKFSDLDSKYHHLIFLTEEQRNDNTIALDAVRHTMEEMIGLKSRVEKLENATGV